MITVKVLGPGCDNCKKVEAAARQALASIGMQAEVIKVVDYGEIMKYPILSTRGLSSTKNWSAPDVFPVWPK